MMLLCHLQTRAGSLSRPPTLEPPAWREAAGQLQDPGQGRTAGEGEAGAGSAPRGPPPAAAPPAAFGSLDGDFWGHGVRSACRL